MVHITGDDAVDKLLSDDSLALVIAMVLDQQIPLERAFRSPFDLKERLGGKLDVAAIASMDPDSLAEVFSARPALHRFPKSMARRVQEVCSLIVDEYDGDTAAIWTTAADGKQLLANVKALPGFGEQKARIFVALLGKAARGPSRGMGAGSGTVRRVQVVPLGGRHRFTGGTGQGSPVQTADEGKAKAKASKAG